VAYGQKSVLPSLPTDPALSAWWAVSKSGQAGQLTLRASIATAPVKDNRDKREVIMTVEKIMLEGFEGIGSEEVRDCLVSCVKSCGEGDVEFTLGL